MLDPEREATGHQYQDELGRRLFKLAFAPALEDKFRTDYANSVIRRRLILFATVAAALLAQPLMDRWLLFPPAAFVPLERLAQFGLMLPVVLLAIAVTAIPRFRKFSDIAAVCVALAVTAGLLYQRRTGADLGYYVPSALAATVLLAGALVA